MSEFTINGRTITEELEKLSGFGNKTFITSLHPGVPHVLGVRIPDLRTLAKRIVESDWEDYLSEAGTYYMEERILQGLVLGYIHPDDDVDKYLRRVSRFVQVINSWSVCDTFSFAGGHSYIKKHQAKIWDYLKYCMNSSEEYEIRFGVVMALKYFIDDQHVVELLKCVNEIYHEGYYVKMAIAWAVSVCFVKYPKETMFFLHDNRLDDFTFNKSLQKILESCRVGISSKQLIKTMRRK